MECKFFQLTEQLVGKQTLGVTPYMLNVLVPE